MAAKLKVDDEVVVIPGRDKGQHGRILSIGRKHERVVVEGAMMIKHHNKAGHSQQGGPTGGIETKEAAIHISNVMYYEPAATRAESDNVTKKIPDTRVRIHEKVVDHDGKKRAVRVCVFKATEKDP